MDANRRYFVGIDVGLNSVGFAAIEVDESGTPLALLNSMVLVHDSGVDPDSFKSADTRKKVSGLARRTRRLYRERRRRLLKLDRVLERLGFPLVDLAEREDALLPWKARADLATRQFTDLAELDEALSIAVRHMARHRGWRNPYARVESLLTPAEPSEWLLALRKRVEDGLGRSLPVEATPAQLVLASGLTKKLRGDGGIIGGKLHQGDNANELRVIAATQGIPPAKLEALIRAVFAARSPKGSAAERVGRDVLPGQAAQFRVSKASPAFQLYRIVTVVANLRIREPGVDERTLSVGERQKVIALLIAPDPDLELGWADVAEALDITRSQLRGTADMTADGERMSARPPIDVTDVVIRTSKHKKLMTWWKTASANARESMIDALSNAGPTQENAAVDDEIDLFYNSLNDDELAKLDNLELPSGRAAYSLDSVRRLTRQMLKNPFDLHQARREEFGIEDDWTPPTDPIGMPLGNPSVDRVLKAVARWLSLAEKTWGAPQSVVVEHVRAGMVSERAAREMDRENSARFRAREGVRRLIKADLGLKDMPLRSDVARFEAVTRQNCQCAYCGGQITYHTAEMDHVVPRAGAGSTNTRSNLLAVCAPCNRSKGKVQFSKWAEDCEIEGVSVDGAVAMVGQWPEALPGMSRKDRARLQREVIFRLRQTEDDLPIDARSIESVAWMATELQRRIKGYYADQQEDVRVAVYRGSLTSEARKASGIENRLRFIGGAGKTRLDRRHHAIDAAVVAMLRQSVAMTLTERSSIRRGEQATGTVESWKGFSGTAKADQVLYARWREQMNELLGLLQTALDSDRIPVQENVRLRFSVGSAHQATDKNILVRKLVGDELSVEQIDRSSTPALWCALTRHPDFDTKDGLPENPSRVISVQGRRYEGDDWVGLFPSAAAALLVRSAAAPLANAIHHARIYRLDGDRKPKYAMLRVFSADLLRHRKEDLFRVELPPQSISRRTAEQKLRKALDDGTASYLGWLVQGDEILVSGPDVFDGMVTALNAVYPAPARWRVSGFPMAAKIRLRHSFLSIEGLPADADPAVRKILDLGWRVAVNKLFTNGSPTVIRRDAIGRPRLTSAAHLPVCWTVGDELDG